MKCLVLKILQYSMQLLRFYREYTVQNILQWVYSSKDFTVKCLVLKIWQLSICSIKDYWSYTVLTILQLSVLPLYSSKEFTILSSSNDFTVEWTVLQILQFNPSIHLNINIFYTLKNKLWYFCSCKDWLKSQRIKEKLTLLK